MIEVYSSGQVVWGGATHTMAFHGMRHCCLLLFSGGLPTTTLAVVKINAGVGNPFRDLVVVISGGVVTLWEAELAVVGFFSHWVSTASDGSDLRTIPVWCRLLLGHPRGSKKLRLEGRGCLWLAGFLGPGQTIMGGWYQAQTVAGLGG